MAPTPASRRHRLGVMAAIIAVIGVLREIAFRRNDRLHPVEDLGRAP